MEKIIGEDLERSLEKGPDSDKTEPEDRLENIPDRLFRELALMPEDRVVMDLWSEGRRVRGVTAGKLAAEALSVASYLLDADVSRGDRVVITGPTGPEWCVSYLGVVSIGAVAVPVDPELPADDMALIIEDSEASLIIHGLGTEAFAALDPEKVRLVSMSDPALVSNSWTGAEMPWRSFSGRDLASLIYTSGTTGRPKGVMLSHSNFLSNVESIMNLGIIGPSDHILGILPLHHVYPFMVSFIGPLIVGGSITFLQSLKGPEIVETINRAGVTILPGVPRLFALMYQAMRQKINSQSVPVRRIFSALAALTGFLRRRAGINVGRILFAPVHRRFGRKFRFFVSGGAKLDMDVAEGLESLGFEIYEGYGLTETSPAAAFNRPGANRPGSVGQAVPGVSLMIDKKSDAVGEIMISGPNVMQGYYRNRDETDAVLRDGWFRTGDLGYMDDDGYLFITGRSKEVIVLSSGKNVFPEDVEKRFLAEPVIEEICIFASTGSEAVEALIVPALTDPGLRGMDEAGVWQALREVVERVSEELPPYQRPRGFRVIRQPLPRTPLGKLRRFQVMKILEKAERLQAEKPVSTDDRRMLESPAGRAVIEALKPVLKDGSLSIRPDHDIEFDLGIDSLGRVEIFSILGVVESAHEEDIRTVLDLINAVARAGYRTGRPVEQAGWGEILARGPDQEDLAFMAARGKESVFVNALRAMIIGIVRAMFRLKVKGTENIPGQGPFIIASNHASYVDGFLVGATVPRPVLRNLYTIGLEEYFRGPLSSVLTSTAHVIPIDTEKHLERAMRMSAHVLGTGRILSIFPEGGRSYDGEIMEFRKGLGILSVELDVPVVPCYIGGTYAVWSRHMLLPRPFKRVSLIFGKPVNPAEVIVRRTERSQDEKYSLVIESLRRIILEMSVDQ